jgi:hypothetical protein
MKMHCTPRNAKGLAGVCCGLSLAFLSVSSLTGCGKLESGAHAEPSVRIKLVEIPGTPKDAGGSSGNSGNTETPVAASGAAGTFFGRVIFKGAAPSPKVMYAKGKAPKESDVCSASGDIMVEDLVIGADNGIANVFIYLDKPPKGYNKAAPPKDPIPFDQKNCTFLTRALICQVGQPVQIINDDDVPHNTKNFPLKNDQFSPTIGKKDRVGSTVVYKKAENKPVGVKCDFHAWMSAYHLPIDHPFGAVTDKDGNFKIENLPPGDHVFKIWHEKAEGGKGGYLESKYKVTVKGEMKSVDIPEDAAKFGL